MAESKPKSETKTKKTTSKKVEEVEKKIDEKVEAVVEEVVETTDTEDKPLAKAGKRSAKAVKEDEEKQAKEERKQTKTEAETSEESKPKVTQKPPRSKFERKGKNYRKLSEQIDKSKIYELKQALDLAVKTSPSKFDSTVEVHVRLGVDPRQADQNIRDNVVLPAGSGKTIKVAVYAEDDALAAAKKAGAEVALADELLQQLEKGIINFDILITTPSQMQKLSKYARLLGPKGLMPNPKNGTVTNDVEKAVNDAKAGKVEYRIDSSGIIHLGIGKTSFGSDKLLDNAQAVLTSIKSNKPTGLKGNYVVSVYITTTMGPSIQVERNI